MTTRLQKFIEIGSHDRVSGRVAFVMDVSALPPPARRKDWQRIASFRAAEDVSIDPGLKSVFKTAIDKAAPYFKRQMDLCRRGGPCLVGAASHSKKIVSSP
jgi:hypothetical protein